MTKFIGPVKPKSRYEPREVKLLTLRECSVLDPMIDTPEKAVEFFRENVANGDTYHGDVENFVVFMLNTRRRLISFSVISTGTLDTILVHPREVFRAAIVANAGAIIIAHNHPSGDSTPSEADIKVTRDLIRAGQLLKIECLDHVIIGSPCEACEQYPNGNKGYCSLRELGYFYN